MSEENDATPRPDTMKRPAAIEGHEAIRLCGAKKHQGAGTCRKTAGWGTSHPGAGPCRLHGGSTPTVSRGAERELADREAVKVLAGIGQFAPVDDPVAELQRLAGRAVKWMTVMEDSIIDLERIRYSSATAEQVDGRVTLYERAMASTSAILQGLARLNLDERSVRVQEAQVGVLVGAMRQALAEAGLADEMRQAIVVRTAELVDQAEEHGVTPPRRRLTA